MVLVMLFDAVPVTALAEDEDIQPEAVVTALAEGEEKKPEDEVTASAEGEEKKPEAEAAASAEGENTQPKAEGDTSVESGNAAVETNPVSRGGQLNVEKANYHLLKANEYTVISVTGSFDRFLDPNYILGSASQAEETRGLNEEGDSASSASDTPELLQTIAAPESSSDTAEEPKNSNITTPAVPAIQQVKGLVAYEIELNEGVPFAEEYNYQVQIPVGVNMLAGKEESGKIIKIDKVDYRLFHLHTNENGTVKEEEITTVSVNQKDGAITDFSFTVKEFSTFVLVYTVDYYYISTIGKLSINYENLKESGNELLQVVQENNQYVTILDAAGILADSPIAENEDALRSDLSRVFLSNAAVKEDFGGEFFAAAAVTAEGQGVEYKDGSIRLTGDVELGTVTFTTKYAILTVEIANYKVPAAPVVPKTTDGFTYRFAGETATVAEILESCGIVSSYYISAKITDAEITDPEKNETDDAVTIEDGTLTAADYFDAVTLTVTLFDNSKVDIALTNPAPAEYTYRAKEENVLLSDVFAALKITHEIESVESSTEKIVISSTKADAASTEDGEKKETEKTETEETKTEETKTEETKTEKAETEVITLVISGDGDLLVTAKDGLKLVIHIIAPAPAVKGEVEATAAGAKAITIAFDEKAGLPATAVLTAEAVTDDNAAFAQYKDLAQSLAQSTFEQAELEKKAQAAAPRLRGGLRMMKSAAPLMATQALTDDSDEAKGEADTAENAAVSAQGAVNSAITKTTTQTEVAGVFELTLQDTAFEEGDNELQPKEAVTVSLELDQTLPANSTVYAIHFYTDEDGEPQQDAIPASAQSSTEGGTLVSFPAEGFSVYAITYTVGLYSGGYTHHLMVGQSITLSKLFTLFNLDKISEVASVEFSDPELMTVEALENDWLLTCLDHFDPSVSQTLTVTLLNGEVYTINVADAGITQQYVAADGETYEINIKFGADAQLPVDAVLSVEEIGPEHEKYQVYLAQALAALGVNAEPAGEEAEAEAEEETDSEEEAVEARNQFARFFDISIMQGEEKVQPQANVTVSIKLADAPEDGDMKVVHFDGENGLVVMQAEKDENDNLLVTTDSFSVYGVIHTSGTPTDVTDLNGQMFTVNYSGAYMTATSGRKSPLDVLVSTTTQSDATVWVFEDAGQPTQYYISTTANGTKQYLNLDLCSSQDWSANALLSDTPQVFSVSKSGDSYQFSTISGPANEPKTYYLCARWMDEANYYHGIMGNARTDTKFTLTFTQTAINTNETGNYAVIILNPSNNTYYAVQNDGSLVQVTYSEQNNTAGVILDYPLLWTYTSANDGLGDDALGNGETTGGSPYNIRIAADARGYDVNQLPQGYYYRYPAS